MKLREAVIGKLSGKVFLETSKVSYLITPLCQDGLKWYYLDNDK